MGLTGGVLVGNPAPVAAEIPAAEMSGFIGHAVREGEQRGISGKAVTPWILGRIVELSGGRSLRTNIALLQSNARLAGEIALAHRADPVAAR
jgi:pseudouridine-5'-phosphate glycosidase